MNTNIVIFNTVTATPSTGIHANYRWDGVDSIETRHS